MSWRFKASKYKNAAPVVPKFENLVRDISVGSFMSHGNLIAASAAYFVFNWEANGSNLAVLPIDSSGRQNKQTMPLIRGHAEFVTDFQFSPFDDGLLATGSQDTTVKLWRIPEKMPTEGLSNPECTMDAESRRIETVNFNPAADCVLATSSANVLTVWDLLEQKKLLSFGDHGDDLQNVAWQTTGQILATTCRDRKLRIVDPRSASSQVSCCQSHQGVKDSKVVWLADGNRILTTGFSSDRLREITIRDLRSLETPQKNQTLDMSSGILIPLYDPDTNMCFLCGKGDRNVQFVEITDREPFIIEGLNYSGDQTRGACLVPKRAVDVMRGEVNRILQLCGSSVVPVTWQVPRKSYREYHSDIFPETNGCESLMGPEEWRRGDDRPVPKISLDPAKRPKEIIAVLRGPLANRRWTSSSPPPTNVAEPEPENEVAAARSALRTRTRGVIRSHVMTKDRGESLQGGTKESPNAKPRKLASPFVKPRHISNGSSSGGDRANDPGNVDEGLAVLRRQPSIRDRKKMFEENIQRNRKEAPPVEIGNGLRKLKEENKENPSVIEGEAMEVVGATPTKQELPVAGPQSSSVAAAAKTPRPVSKMFGRISKFKHLKGEVMLTGKFENLKNLSRTVPAECDFFHANPDRIAVPLAGPGGKLAVLETKKPGRIPDGVQPVLINGTTVMDFAFDPFDNRRLVAGCDDGFVRVWKVPESGLVEQTNEPEFGFPAHGDKIQIVKFHPLAEDILLTAAFDRTVKIWHVGNCVAENAIELEGHVEQLFSAEWSPCGNFVATVCKDGKIRIYEPRKDCSPGQKHLVSVPVREGAEIVPKKGARILWVLQGEYLVVCGFGKQSERQVMIFRASDLDLINNVVLDVSPTILVPYYDEGSSTLFVTGKGEGTVTTFEVARDFPHLFPLAPYKPPGLHQGFAFLPKNVCNVRAVEFARAFRLTNSTIEPISFTVPRVKMAFFQDDLFPPARILWKPTLTGCEWLSGSPKQSALLDLRPEDMSPLSSARTAPASLAGEERIPVVVKNPPANMERLVCTMLNTTAGPQSESSNDDDEDAAPKEWD